MNCFFLPCIPRARKRECQESASEEKRRVIFPFVAVVETDDESSCEVDLEVVKETKLVSILRNKNSTFSTSTDSTRSADSDSDHGVVTGESDCCYGTNDPKLCVGKGTRNPSSTSERSNDQSRKKQERVRVAFDPRIWIREFERTVSERESIWYTSTEIEKFRNEAFDRIAKYNARMQTTQLIPTGTGRVVQVRKRVMEPIKLDFSHQALRAESEDDNRSFKMTPNSTSINSESVRLAALADAEIQNILIVDPHQICLQLFRKALKLLVPNATITTVTTGEDALRNVKEGEKQFDLIIVEERLKSSAKNHYHSSAPETGDLLVSGSMLLQRLSPINPKALYVGVSVHPKEDGAKLQRGGADLCWPKPPPSTNETLLKSIMEKLLEKRGRRMS